MVVEKAKDFWVKYQRPLMIVSALVIIIAGGFLGYKNFVKLPNEAKAEDAIFKAEEYYRMDSLDKALNGDMLNAGFLKVISKYGNTDAGKRARLYAGDCLLRKGDFAQAVKYLKEFSTDSKMIQAVAYKLTADAYSEQGKNDEAIDYYKKAAHHFEADKDNSSLYLSMAAGLCEKTGKTKEAIELYKELKEKFPKTAAGFDADKYLGKLGAYN
ncbi:MAG: tetratricopeptide repeat protein [Terrimonas sp.]|nr:tetratricopeptide repeat protein [Terrimonas sp.]